MDMDHLRRKNLAALGRAPAGLDYRVLVATVQAWQISTATARAEGRCGEAPLRWESAERCALTRILLGGRDWQQAVLAQGGSFNPIFARCTGERQ
jgi:hypothetical protein